MLKAHLDILAPVLGLVVLFSAFAFECTDEPAPAPAISAAR